MSHDKHLTNMSFRLDVAFESVFIATLFFTDLTVPSESLESLGLLLICYCFGGAFFGPRHGGRWMPIEVFKFMMSEFVVGE